MMVSKVALEMNSICSMSSYFQPLGHMKASSERLTELSRLFSHIVQSCGRTSGIVSLLSNCFSSNFLEGHCQL